jgi:syntaxin 7
LVPPPPCADPKKNHTPSSLGSSSQANAAEELAPLAPQGEAAGKATRELKAVQFQANTAFTRLREDVSRLGTPGDTPALRRRITAGSQRFSELAKEFGRLAEDHPSKESTATQKVVRDFQGLLSSWERLMVAAREREAATLPRGAEAAAAAAELDAAASAADREELARRAATEHRRKEQLLQTEAELRFNEAIIEERDEAIVQISGQIGEVHQIFQDLAVLVHDQGEALDDIESNLTRAAGRTSDARLQIGKAERLQRRARNTWCFLMMLAAGTLAVLLVVLLS